MSGVLTWFIEMIICSGILYLNYYVLLRNNRFHSYNRYYLLAAVALSILIPFVQIPVDFNASRGNPAAILQALTAISSVTENKHIHIAPENAVSVFTAKNVLTLLYIVMALALIARFVRAIIFIGKLLRRYKAERTANIYFVNTAEPTTPFSFFKWLFWNNKIELQSENGQQIFRHELFHIQQRHSWDLAFLELTGAIFWINPFLHFIQKEVKTIHEFLADEFATKENDKGNYAELLLIRVLDSSSHRLVNPFFHNQIKRRIAMITSSKTPKYQFFRKLMILPIAILVIALFAFKIKTYSDKTIPEPALHHVTADMRDATKVLAFESSLPGPDTIKPKEKQKTKKADDQKSIENKKNDAENAEFQKLTEEKAREAQESQEMLKKLMAERQREMTKYQEEFKKMIEMSQREAQENQEKLKLLLEQRQKEAARYQEEFKKMMEKNQFEAQKEGQEKFKQLMEERQKEAEKFQDQFKEMFLMKQKEAEKSQEELKKLLQERQMQMQQWQEDFKKKMMLMQEEQQKARKQVI
jgi:beta-lactamase regulating signal transducer with metallopeptidase domain